MTQIERGRKGREREQKLLEKKNLRQKKVQRDNPKDNPMDSPSDSPVDKAKKPKKTAKKKVEKKQYAEFVSLKEEEYQKLVQGYGQGAADKFIEELKLVQRLYRQIIQERLHDNSELGNRQGG